MWFNRRKDVGSALTPAAGHLWENAQGQLAGLPAYLRINSTLKPRAPLAGFASEVSVVIAFNTAGENGMPTSEDDLTGVEEIEDRIKSVLEESQETIMAVVVTHGGCRRLTFYSTNPRAAIASWEQHLAPHIDTHQVEFAIKPDPQWTTYLDFA